MREGIFSASSNVDSEDKRVVHCNRFPGFELQLLNNRFQQCRQPHWAAFGILKNFLQQSELFIFFIRQPHEWVKLSRLSANPQKTEYMFIGHPNRTNKIMEQEELELNGSEIN